MNIKRSLAGEDDTHGKETVEFLAERGRADAAADLAGDLSAQFLEGATSGEDVSERAVADDEAEERALPGFQVETLDSVPLSQVEADMSLAMAANAADANGKAVAGELDRNDSDAITDVVDEKDIISEDVITSVGEVEREDLDGEDRTATPVPSKPASSKPRRPPPRKRARAGAPR